MSDDNESLYCPITQEIFRDPVIAEDGRLYEREAITRWINENGTSPFTRQTLNVNHLQPDEHIRKKADRRRRLSVTYNREADQVVLPPIRPPLTVHIAITLTDRRSTDEPTSNIDINGDEPRVYQTRSPRKRCASCVSWMICGIIAICTIVGSVSIGTTLAKSSETSTSTSTSKTSYSDFCYEWNQMPTKDACLASFKKITYIQSSVCSFFPYKFITQNFIAVSSHTTIIFAFQQNFGFWDIDNITLWSYNLSQNIFQNGGFESGSLSPHYNRCQSASFISNNSQFNGRYCYSDYTTGTFGYLMQRLSTTPGSWYYLNFYLQNRNGYDSSFMVLLGI